jgi:succinoglycan biosynthesis transport protein ExoP
MVERKPMTAKRVVGPDGQGPSTVALTPKQVVAVLRRHLLLIIVVTVLGFVAGGAGWVLLRHYLPKYTAQTYFEVLPPVETDPMDIVATQVQKDVQYGHRELMANSITQQSTFQELLGRPKVRDTSWFKRFAKLDAGGNITNVAQCISKGFKDLRRHFRAFAHRDAQFVSLSMTWRNARESATIVNEMLDLFLARQGSTKREDVADRLARLEEQRVRVQRDLDAAERSLSDVREAWGITDLEQPVGRYFKHTITLRLDDLELQQNELLLGIRQTQADIENLRELATGPVTVQIEHAIEMDPVMTALAQQLAMQEAVLQGRLSRLGENHRLVRQAQELIDEIREERRLRKEKIAEQTRQASLENARDRLVVLQQRLVELQKLRDEAAAQQKDLDLARIQYGQRLKIRDERLEMLDALKEQIEKLKIMHDDPETPKVQFAGYAPEPLEMAASRQWWLWLPGGTIVGLLLGIGLAFLGEMLNDFVRTPTDVARFLRVPLLGVVPDASEDKQVRDIDLCHVVRQAPYSIISESYRRCRTNLELSSSADSMRAILVTSGGAGDGKTSAAVNLATAFVAERKRVLLIDANFRQPSLKTVFPNSTAKSAEAGKFDFGLSSVLTNQCGFNEAIRSTGVQGLDVIDAGPPPSNPAELLASPRMAEILRELRRSYAYIVVDSPPVLLVSDAKVLARQVDGTVLIFNAAATRRGAAQRTIRELEEVGAKVLGCVLLGARALKGGYFHEQFKSYQRYQKPQLATT